MSRSIRQHRELILNYFRAQKLLSSGVVEGLNNKATVLYPLVRSRKPSCAEEASWRSAALSRQAPEIKLQASKHPWAIMKVPHVFLRAAFFAAVLRARDRGAARGPIAFLYG